MHRYFLEIAFRGSNYRGWQVQPGEKTVQQSLETALSTLLSQPTPCVGCGRTDSGVHANQFYVHFDAAEVLQETKFMYRLNALLDLDIAVRRIIPVKEEAHARFDAIERTYRYFIHQQKNPFLNDRSTFVVGDPDMDLMNQAAEYLVGTMDYQSFAKVNSDVKHHQCEVFSAFWYRHDDQFVFEISANRFLRNMVRAIVGTLLEVGAGKMTLERFKYVVESRDRSNAGKSVDARGLFLHQVKYPFIS